ncbi:MAG: hypothetical protein ACLFNJ_05955 [Bacteroidales bacterium]
MIFALSTYSHSQKRMIYDEVSNTIVASGGVHSADKLFKMLLAGTDSVQVVSAIYRNGPGYIRDLLAGVEKHMEKKGLEDLQQVRELGGKMAPDQYGYFNINWEPLNHWEVSTDATYTGDMIVPYFGPLAENPEEGILKESDPFFDWSVKLTRCIETTWGDFDIYIGSENILNSYQSDFDTGKERDPGYIYGPISPRTIYAGVKISNIF